MSGASDILDPVEAAQDDISRSKRAIASALDDLSQHHSWLESYHRDERRRAQRLRRQEALEALELRRQRAAWMLRRFAQTSLAVTRATAVFLARNGAAFLAWATPRAQALALLLARESSAALAWSWRTGRDLAHRGFEGASTGFAWTVRTSDALGLAFRQAALDRRRPALRRSGDPRAARSAARHQESLGELDAHAAPLEAPRLHTANASRRRLVPDAVTGARSRAACRHRDVPRLRAARRESRGRQCAGTRPAFDRVRDGARALSGYRTRRLQGCIGCVVRGRFTNPPHLGEACPTASGADRQAMHGACLHRAAARPVACHSSKLKQVSGPGSAA